MRYAINQSEDELVQLFDRELQAIVNDILAYQASNREELYRQFQFLCTLVRDEADDRLAVVRRSVMMSGLIDRYFRDHSDWSGCGFVSGNRATSQGSSTGLL